MASDPKNIHEFIAIFRGVLGDCGKNCTDCGECCCQPSTDKGGAGSGCRGENCGRPSGSASNERVTVGEGKPARISEGGQTSKPPTISETKPRPIAEIREDLEAARQAADQAERNMRAKPGNLEARNEYGRAQARVREVEREGRAAVEHARNKPKKDVLTIAAEVLAKYSNTMKNLAELEKAELKVSRREGESLDDCVSRGIQTLINEGYEPAQAAAIAYKMCEEKGFCPFPKKQ